MFDNKDKVCPNCGKHHEELSIDNMAEEFTDAIFPQIWKDSKKKLKEMSKKEIAEQMYFLGVRHFMQKIQENLKCIENKLKK
jgi:DNA repair exonuclease SbcCD ATPase subunit